MYPLSNDDITARVKHEEAHARRTALELAISVAIECGGSGDTGTIIAGAEKFAAFLIGGQS